MRDRRCFPVVRKDRIKDMCSWYSAQLSLIAKCRFVVLLTRHPTARRCCNAFTPRKRDQTYFNFAVNHSLIHVLLCHSTNRTVWDCSTVSCIARYGSERGCMLWAQPWCISMTAADGLRSAISRRSLTRSVSAPYCNRMRAASKFPFSQAT